MEQKKTFADIMLDWVRKNGGTAIDLRPPIKATESQADRKSVEEHQSNRSK